jgi:hypothetical protein
MTDVKHTPKLTPWFPGDVKPAHHGLYEREYSPSEIYLQLWTGNAWHFASFPATSCMVQDAPWRGLASDPNDQGTGFLPKKLEQMGSKD